jgi:NDP-sugar pyrophosphorylase family protein
MRKKTRITITLLPEILKKVDSLIDQKTIKNRSQSIENLIIKGLGPNVKTAVILAGGKKTSDISCALKKINNRYLLTITIEQLKKYGITQIIICSGANIDKIKQVFGDGSSLGVNIIYSQEKRSMGTAGAIKLVEHHLQANPFLVIHGDILTNLNISEFINFHMNENKLATIGVKPRMGEKKYGQVFLQGNTIINFSKISTSKGISIINTGLYILSPEVLEMIKADTISYLESDIFPQLAKEKNISAFIFQGLWYDISTSKNYQEAKSRWDQEILKIY